jgi:hypothetical protein
MIAYLLYNRQTPAEEQMRELGRRLEPLRVTYELVDADSPQGIGLAEAHGIMARPAVLLTRDDGSHVQVWEGDQLPPPTEISYLAHQ